MEKMRALFSVVLLALILVPVAQAQRQVEAQPPATGEQQQKKPFEPNYDREIFKKSGTSIARGDLLACRNRDAQITQGAYDFVAIGIDE